MMMNMTLMSKNNSKNKSGELTDKYQERFRRFFFDYNVHIFSQICTKIPTVHVATKLLSILPRDEWCNLHLRTASSTYCGNSGP